MGGWLGRIFRGLSGVRRNGASGSGPDNAARKAGEREAIAEADALRDAGRFAEAAEAYAAALAVSPARNDLRVQRANMLKDAERLKDAILVYRVAEAIEPAGPARADIRLQWARALRAADDPRGAGALYEACIAEASDTELGVVALAELSRLRRQHLSPYWL